MSPKANPAKEISQILPAFLKRIHSGLMEKIDVPPAQMAAIMILSERKEKTVGELSTQMKVSAPTVTGIVDRLQRSGLAKRQRDTKDRRVVRIALTLKGKKVSGHLQRAFMQRWGVIASILSVKDQQTYVQLLKKIIKGFDEKMKEVK
ncbi:MAG: MarR family transcriptional regulator [Candidatus Aceula meridiana]|nr:MarR family transcriptional regulator [Candidatus Aceula meridiana]